MQSEIKNTVFLSINLILLAMVLRFAIFGIDLRNDLAEIRNSEVVAKETTGYHLKFDAYQAPSTSANLTGMGLIRLITEFQREPIDIYVMSNDVSIESTGFSNASLVSSGSNGLLLRSSERLNYTELYKMNTESGTLGTITDSPLIKMFANTNEKASNLHYRSYLVYDGVDVKTATEKGNSSGVVTGIVIKYIP